MKIYNLVAHDAFEGLTTTQTFCTLEEASQELCRQVGEFVMEYSLEGGSIHMESYRGGNGFCWFAKCDDNSWEICPSEIDVSELIKKQVN